MYPSITCSHTPDELDYLGILSLIFWTLTLIGIIKYTFIVLYADDHGEGAQLFSHKNTHCSFVIKMKVARLWEKLKLQLKQSC